MRGGEYKERDRRNEGNIHTSDDKRGGGRE
jgi:hypothetical protein